MRRQKTRFEKFTKILLGNDSDEIARHRIRAYVLEQATVLEVGIDEVLAASIASGLQAEQVLRSEVLWRLPIPVRLEMLGDLLERTELQDRWPFVMPVLRTFFELRHQLAHGLVGWIDVTGSGVKVTTLKRGKIVETTYRGERLIWLAWQARVTEIELSQIWAAVVPSTREWREWS